MLFLLCLGLHAWLASGGWRSVLLDTHGFRQTQTALVAQGLLRNGFHLAYVMPVLGAPWSVPFEFPFYQATVAACVHFTHWPLESCGRLVALGYFYAALPALWLLLLRLGISAAHRWLFLGLVLSCPVYLFFSRTFLIESTAFCFSLWFIYFFHAALEPRRWFVLAGAALCGGLAAVTKVTTFAVFLTPAAVLLLHQARQASATMRLILGRAIIAVLPGLALAAWWIAYSDQIKRLNPFGADMTAPALRSWVFGSTGLRLSVNFWAGLGAQLERAVLPSGSLLLLAVLGLLFLRGPWRLFLWLLAVAATGPLVFANLYLVHDYYWYASGVFFMALAALPLQSLMRQQSLSLPVRLGPVIFLFATQITGYLQSYYQPQTRTPREPPELTRAIALATRPDDILLGLGLNWDPEIPYYSGRRAVFVPDASLTDPARIEAALRQTGPIAAVVIYRNTPGGVERFNPWLERLGMDPTPLFSTGEYHVHLRKDLLPAALQAVATMKFKDVLVYLGRAGPTPGKINAVYWVDQLADRSMFAGIHPTPVKVTSPFPPGGGPLEKRLVFSAHASTEIEIPLAAGAKRITAEFGLYPGAWPFTDGVEFEIVHVHPDGIQQVLYHRWLQPAVLASDRGTQSLSLEMLAPISGRLLFRTLPGPAQNDAYDWAYWAKIDAQ